MYESAVIGELPEQAAVSLPKLVIFDMRISLEQQVALVTGASSGIGAG
jgi:hypothetical protein